MKTWRERVAQAKERGYFTVDDHRRAWEDWTTCAVGEWKQQYPTVIVGCTSAYAGPNDPILADLGGGEAGFSFAVDQGDVEKAEQLLDQIEDRVLQLKREST